MAHAPSQARHLRRDLQDPDADVQAVLRDALALGDPAHAAPVLAELASDDRLRDRERDRALAAALAAAADVGRAGQKAEVWQAVLEGLGSPAPDAAVDAAVADVESMPDGEWTLAAVTALADLVGPPGRRRLLERALRNRGFEADGAKAVLAAADLDAEPGLRERVDAIKDPDTRRRILGHLAHHGEGSMQAAVDAAWRVEDRSARLEALRSVAWNCTRLEDLDAVAASVQDRDPDEAARLLCACAARADRAGDRDRLQRWIADAQGLTVAVEDPKRRAKVEAKVQETAQRAGMEAGREAGVEAGDTPPETADPTSPTPEPPTQASAPSGRGGASAQRSGPPLGPPSGHVFAVVDAYSGGLSVQHLRTAARAAALCAAFGHELWLVGFPTDDAAAFLAAAQAETRIGEDAAPLSALSEAGRFRLIAELPEDPPGRLVATTPRPEPDKAADLETLSGPVFLLVGVGSQGLPRDALRRAEAHYELTGRGVSLETASAMGILADRLARVPA